MTALSEAAARYLDLLKLCVSGALSPDQYRFVKRPKDSDDAATFDALRSRGIEMVTRAAPGHDLYDEGGGWPVTGETMIGRKRLDNLQWCVEEVLREQIPGDLIETGVWRGGASILMRAVVAANGDADRRVWVADSFEGVPPPDGERWPADEGDALHADPSLAVPLETVRDNFARYGLLDEQVRFLEGWFRDSLPRVSGETWALIRLDGDLYESTIDALRNLYPNLSPGGYVIVDDYGAMPPCKEAVDDYRREHGIEAAIEPIDWTGVYWRKGAAPVSG